MSDVSKTASAWPAYFQPYVRPRWREVSETVCRRRGSGGFRSHRALILCVGSRQRLSSIPPFIRSPRRFVHVLAFAAVKAGEESLLCRSYSRYPLAIVRGKGSRLWDVDGKEYVDLLAGIAVTALGHCNDEICAALGSGPQALACEQPVLSGRTAGAGNAAAFNKPPRQGIFCNSGAEANEACIKLARRYAQR